MEEYHIVYRKQ